MGPIFTNNRSVKGLFYIQFLVCFGSVFSFFGSDFRFGSTATLSPSRMCQETSPDMHKYHHAPKEVPGRIHPLKLDEPQLIFGRWKSPSAPFIQLYQKHQNQTQPLSLNLPIYFILFGNLRKWTPVSQPALYFNLLESSYYYFYHLIQIWHRIMKTTGALKCWRP